VVGLSLCWDSIATKVSAGELSVDAITEELICEHLLTESLPDPDLLIRTSGEYRLSNFLLYQLAYAEMVFLDKFWPEITEEDLDNVLEGYARRERRYGQ